VDLEAAKLRDKIVESERLLRSLSENDVIALAASSFEVEQLPPRAALALLGDDSSWENARQSLMTGLAFVQEVLDMEGDQYVTARTLRRIEEVGTVDPTQLNPLLSPAAHALAMYLEACLLSAGHRLGGLRTPTACISVARGLPPAWPLVIDFKEILPHVRDAATWGKTALLVCSGHANEADAFFAYRGFATIDAKWILSQVHIKQNMSPAEMQALLQQRLADAMKMGCPLHIALSTSAIDFSGIFCKQAVFPKTVFNISKFREPAEYLSVLDELDRKACAENLKSSMKGDFFSFVTTDMDMDQANEHLPAVLPFFKDMAVIEIDRSSFEATLQAIGDRREERAKAKFGLR